MTAASKPRIVVLGAGFGGLELTTLLSEAFGDSVDVTLIDKSDCFVFGFSKLDVMFGQSVARMPCACPTPAMPSRACGCSSRHHRDRPRGRRVTTEAGIFDADFLVVALGADYDFAGTPGLAKPMNFIPWPAPSGYATSCRNFARAGR